MNLSHKHIEYLLALDRHRNYGRAAEAVGISQPALSRSVLALEKRLDVTIFDRSNSRVVPTAAGQVLLRHARTVSQMATEVESELSALQARAQRKLSVVCGHYPAELTVPQALSALMNEQPDIQVSMEVADWSRGIQMLEQEVCDLAVIELSAVSRQLELQRELLNDQRVYPVVRSGHPLARLERPTLQDVLAWPWASSQVPQRAAAQLGAGPVRAGDFDERTGYFVPKIVASSLSTALKLVVENDIVGFAPLSVADAYLRDGRLRLVPLNARWMRLNYGFAWEARKPQSPATLAFMARMRDAEAAQRERDETLRKRYRLPLD
jgi:DNA-binding transcriptional LysR family regulator